MRDSFHDDRLLDRIMREKFAPMLMAIAEMSDEAVRQYIAEMRPAILHEYRRALALDARWLISRPLR